MASARGDALDWALALARAPGERLVLRQRPLPAGIDSLLQIAAGHVSEELAVAVARTGETEARLIEAVRFYLREVLFHSGADAYRILGLQRDASPDQAKAHHRWLQQWLHPDRHTSDWDAIFAGRVNAAWNQLRTEERRRAYDADHPAAPVASHGPLPAVMASWVRDDIAAPQSPRQRWRRRVPLLALIVACVGLGVLALRDLARDDALVTATVAQAPGEEVGHVLPGSAETDPFSALRLPTRTPAPSTKSGNKPSSKAQAAQAQVSRMPPAVGLQVTAKRPDSRLGAAVPVRAPAPPLPPLASPVPGPRQVAMAPPTAATRSAVPPKEGGPLAPALTRERAGAIAARAESPPPTGTTPALPQASKEVARSAPGSPASVPAERVRQAQQVGDRLVAFMGRPGPTVPPIWDTLSVQQGATRLRGELQAGGTASMSQPDWRVAERDAQMQMSIRYADGSKGRLNAGLVWREQRWLVSRLSMERDH